MSLNLNEKNYIIMRVKSISLISIVAFFLFCGSHAYGWASKTHVKIVSDAYHIMPLAFRKLLGEVHKPKKQKPALPFILRGSLDPDRYLKDFQNHVFHIHGFNMGKGPFHIENMVDEIVKDIEQKQPTAKIARKLGRIAHYISDLVQPLHTGVETINIEEKKYHAATERDADKKVNTYPVYFDGCNNYKRVSARMIYEALWANQYYKDLETAYTTGERYKDSKKVISECYSRAVNNVVDVWYTIWIRSGGKEHKSHKKAKFFPAMEKEE